jgi:hypothetical protein
MQFPAGVLLFVGLAVHAAAQSAPPQAAARPVGGTEIFSEFSWDRDSNVSIDSQNVAFGTEPFHITFSIAYRGLKLAGAPETVDVLLVRERADAAQLGSSADVPPVVAVVDRLPVPLTRQTSEGPDRIKGVLTFDVFQWIVGGATLDFEAFGRRFVLVPNQMVALKQAAAEWAHPGKH